MSDEGGITSYEMLAQNQNTAQRNNPEIIAIIIKS